MMSNKRRGISSTTSAESDVDIVEIGDELLEQISGGQGTIEKVAKTALRVVTDVLTLGGAESPAIGWQSKKGQKFLHG